MDKIKDFLKNKSIGYLIVAGIALASLLVAIIFFITFKNPALDPIAHHNPMGNKADGLKVETIGIFLLAGALCEIAVLVIPQYRFLQVGAIAMFGLSFYKDILIIPDFIVGKINNVEYNGGNFGLNMFFFIMLFLIVIASIVAAFMGFYKDEKEGAAEMKNFDKSPIGIAKVGGAGGLFVIAILVASLAASGVFAVKAAERQVAPKKYIPPFEPITDTVREKADAYSYDHNPESVIIKQQASYNFSNSEMTSLNTSGTRNGHYYVYYFEGAYAEGYQGDYSETYASLYLWEDGMFAGKINDTNIRGYWYNSSLNAPEDDPETEKNEALDCLNMVSNVSKYESIITERADDFYDWRAHVYLGFSWGTRSMEITGYYYYPEVDLAIDTSSTGTEFVVGEAFNRQGWVATRILKNLKYSAVFKKNEVKWNDTALMAAVENGKFKDAGEYEVTATWNGLTASVTVTVEE